jgi:hypothetical protein
MVEGHGKGELLTSCEPRNRADKEPGTRYPLSRVTYFLQLGIVSTTSL